MQLDESFPRNYECDLLDGLPATERYYYPGGSTESGQDGLILQLIPHSSEPWVGVFAFGQTATKGVKTGLYTHPDPDTLFVTVQGDGYLVNVDNPAVWEEVGITPICEVIPIPRKSLLVIANYTEMYALGPDGVVWQTDRLAWSELSITEVSDDFIAGQTWDIRDEDFISFQVDLSTGEHTGGIVEVS